MKQILKATYMAIIVSALLTTGIAPIGVVYADKPITGSGTLENLSAVQYDFRVVGGNTFLTYDATYDFDGPIDGILTIVGGECVIHPNGKGNCYSTGTFSGTVGGKSGTLEVGIPATINPDGSFQGRDISLSGTGDLANLHMVLNFESVLGVGVIGSYSVQYHFDP